MNSKLRYSCVMMAAFGAASSMMAQAEQDTTITRELLIEKQYNPIVRDADKITRMPKVEEPTVARSTVEFAQPVMTATSRREVTDLSVGDVNTYYRFSDKRGYLGFGGGSYLNLQGDIGYRFVDNEATIFGAELNHISTNGKVKYKEDKFGKTELAASETFVKAYYKQLLRRITLESDLAYAYSSYKYHGTTTLYDQLLPNDGLMDAYDRRERSYLDYRLAMHSNGDRSWNYKGIFDVTAMWDDYANIKEQNFDTKFGLSKEFRGDWNMHADLGLSLLMYGGEIGKANNTRYDNLKNSGLLSINPYFSYENEGEFSARLGVNMGISTNVSPKFGISPDVSMQWTMAPYWLLYGNLTGGLKQYSLANISRQYRYNNVAYQLKNAYEVVNMNVGIRTDVAPGFSFDVFGGFSHTANDLFMESDFIKVSEGKSLNTLKAVTYDATKYNIGMKLDYKYGDMFAIDFMAKYNGYNLEDDAIASYCPNFEMDSRIMYKPHNKWRLGLTYEGDMGRKAVINSSNSFGSPIVKDADDIHMVNLELDWLMSHSFTVYLHLNNVLSRQQETYYGMPEQRFAFVLGGSLLF